MAEYKVIDVMLDLETLGVDDRPMLCQLAAVAFDLKTGQTYQEFDQLISPQSASQHGMKVTASTIEWWLKQDQKVIEKVLIKSLLEGKNLKDVLLAFNDFIDEICRAHYIKGYQVRIWGNGFDACWLDQNYKAVGLEMPVPFWQCQDVRSVVDLGRRLLNMDPKRNNPKEGIEHDAIDDCKKQIKYLVPIAQTIMELRALQQKGQGSGK